MVDGQRSGSARAGLRAVRSPPAGPNFGTPRRGATPPRLTGAGTISPQRCPFSCPFTGGFSTVASETCSPPWTPRSVTTGVAEHATAIASAGASSDASCDAALWLFRRAVEFRPRRSAAVHHCRRPRLGPCDHEPAFVFGLRRAPPAAHTARAAPNRQAGGSPQHPG